MGDIILRGDMSLISEGKSGFSLDGGMAVKLPTADEAKGLGTGKTDYGTFVSLHQRFQEIKFSFMAGYIKTGDPSSFDYNDIYLYGFGVSRLFGRTNIYSSFEGRRSIIPGAKNPQELVFGFFYILNNSYSLKGNVSFGLNDGTQDFGSNIGCVTVVLIAVAPLRCEGGCNRRNIYGDNDVVGHSYLVANQAF